MCHKSPMNKTLPLMFLCLLFAAIGFCMQKDPHDFTNDECTICHSTDTQGTKVGGDITKKCMTCHTKLYENGYMHPVDITPDKVSIPLDMPLSDNGSLTCVTCHDPHTPQKTPFGTKSVYLRRFEKGKAFCDICHMNAMPTATGHQVVFRNAHFKEKESPSNAIMHIDDMSRDCISCHDGSFGSSVSLRTGDWSHSTDFLKFDKGGKHPIGMNYEIARSSRKLNMLKPLDAVDKRIRFFNKGCIGCGTCHDPYSVKYKKLVMENKRSALCYSCHK